MTLVILAASAVTFQELPDRDEPVVFITRQSDARLSAVRDKDEVYALDELSPGPLRSLASRILVRQSPSAVTYSDETHSELAADLARELHVPVVAGTSWARPTKEAALSTRVPEARSR